jgi:hypothetical protein
MDRTKPSNRPTRFEIAQVIRNVTWSDWFKVEDQASEFDGLSPPSQNFLMHLQLLLESQDEMARDISIVDDAKHRKNIILKLTAGQPVTLSQIIADITYWPIGTGVILFAHKDGRRCAYIRGADGTIARYSETELFSEGQKIVPIGDILW